jgi:hypothetical protein
MHATKPTTFVKKIITSCFRAGKTGTVPFNSIRQVTGHRPSQFDEMSHLSQVTGPPDEIIQRNLQKKSFFHCIFCTNLLK